MWNASQGGRRKLNKHKQKCHLLILGQQKIKHFFIRPCSRFNHRRLVIVALDTSGQIRVDTDIWIVAVRKQNVTRYTVIHINRDYQDRFQNTTENWVEKLNAILFFRAANTLFMSHDIIQIDKDFLGIHARYVKHYMESLFGKFNFGTDKNKPTIQLFNIFASYVIIMAQLNIMARKAI